jgi:HSP20 family protein
MRQVFGPSMPLLRAAERRWQPNVDVYESEDGVVIVVELAGVTREEVSVVFDDGKLHIRGARTDGTPHGNRRYRQMEICYNEFGRSVYLPDNVDPDGITAKIDNGLMTIKAPKKKTRQTKSHQIEIG